MYVKHDASPGQHVAGIHPCARRNTVDRPACKRTLVGCAGARARAHKCVHRSEKSVQQHTRYARASVHAGHCCPSWRHPHVRAHTHTRTSHFAPSCNATTLCAMEARHASRRRAMYPLLFAVGFADRRRSARGENPRRESSSSSCTDMHDAGRRRRRMTTIDGAGTRFSIYNVRFAIACAVSLLRSRTIGGLPFAYVIHGLRHRRNNDHDRARGYWIARVVISRALSRPF